MNNRCSKGCLSHDTQNVKCTRCAIHNNDLENYKKIYNIDTVNDVNDIIDACVRGEINTEEHNTANLCYEMSWQLPMATQFNCIKIMKYSFEYLLKANYVLEKDDHNSILYSACLNEDISILRLLYKYDSAIDIDEFQYGVWDMTLSHDLVGRMIKYNYIDAIKFLIDETGPLCEEFIMLAFRKDDALACAAVHENIELAKVFCEKKLYNLAIEYDDTLNQIAQNGYLELLDLMYGLGYRFQHETQQWIISKFDRTIETIVKNGHMNVLRWLVDHGYKISSELRESLRKKYLN